MQQLLFEVENVPFPTPEHYSFKFIDLFAGIGGFRIAMQNLGGKCVFTSEWDKNAQKTYKVNFGEVPFGDINNLENIVNFFITRNTNANAESFNSKIKLFRANQRCVVDNKFFLFRLHKLFA